MAYRVNGDDLPARIADIERRLRAVEQPGSAPPDPGWVLREVNGVLLYLYSPTGAQGPIIGVK